MSTPVCLLSAHGRAWRGSRRSERAVKTQHDKPRVHEKCGAPGPKGGLTGGSNAKLGPEI